MADEVMRLCEAENHFQFVYPLEASIREKIEMIASKIYRADGVIFEGNAKKQLAQLEALGFDRVPVCMAKTQFSFSDNPALLGAPRGFHITDYRFENRRRAAGFIVAETGQHHDHAGLPKVPAAERIDVDNTGKITGLF